MTMLPGISDSIYHGTAGVTFHRLMDFVNHGPAYYHARYVSGAIAPKPDTDWGQLGRAYHLFGLEGEHAFAEQVVVMPATYWTDPPIDAPWNTRKKYCQEWTKANPGTPTPATFPDGDPVEERPWNLNASRCKAWIAERAGKIILSSSDYDAAVAIGRNMRSNTHAARLLAKGWPELTIERAEPGFPIPVKCRIDWLASTSTKESDAWAIVDPKGTDNLDGFERDAFKYRYHRQLAFYRWMVQQEIGKQLPCFLPAVEKSHMHRCRVFSIDPVLLDEGAELNERDMERLKACYAADAWPLDHDDSMRVWSPRPSHANAPSANEEAPW